MLRREYHQGVRSVARRIGRSPEQVLAAVNAATAQTSAADARAEALGRGR